MFIKDAKWKKKLDTSSKKILVKIFVTAACIHKDMKNYVPQFYCINEAATLVDQEFFCWTLSRLFQAFEEDIGKF